MSWISSPLSRLNPEKTSNRRFAAELVVVAFAIRLAWILIMNPAPLSDMNFYYEQGISISQGIGYVQDGDVGGYVFSDFPAGSPTADRPVGYSAFLGLLFWAFGPSVFVGKLANVILSTATIFLFYRLAQKLSATQTTARITAVVLAFFPNQIAYCSLLSDSVLFQFLLILGFSLIVQSRGRLTILAAGIVFGFASLTRTYGIVLPLLWGTVLWRSLGWRVVSGRLAIVCIGLALVVSPWTIRNYRAFGEFALVSTNFGHNFLAGHWDGCNGQWTPSPEANEPGYRDEIERDHALRKKAFEYILDHPARTVWVAFPKMLYMYAEDADGLRWNIKGQRHADRTSSGANGDKRVRYRFWEYAGMAVFEIYYLVVLLGFLGCLIAKIRGRLGGFDPQWLGLWTIIYFTMIAIAFFGMSRFHYPIVPFLALYAGAFYTGLRRKPGANDSHSSAVATGRRG